MIAQSAVFEYFGEDVTASRLDEYELKFPAARKLAAWKIRRCIWTSFQAIRDYVEMLEEEREPYSDRVFDDVNVILLNQLMMINEILAENSMEQYYKPWIMLITSFLTVLRLNHKIIMKQKRRLQQ